MRKLVKWFFDRYVDLAFWWNRTKLERELDREFQLYSTARHEIHQDDNERKYAEGMAIVKNKINAMASSRSKEEYDSVLKEVKDLVSIAREETPGQLAIRKILTNLSRLPEKSRKKMIQERIGHYEELKKYNEERALIKQIKQARKKEDNELADKLQEEWSNTYGKVRNTRRR